MTTILLLAAVLLLPAAGVRCQPPTVTGAETRVDPGARDFVLERLRRLEDLTPHVSTEYQIPAQDVERFHRLLDQARKAAGQEDWAAALRAVTNGPLNYFVDHVLMKENRISRRLLVAGPFPESGCPDLEKDLLERAFREKPYPGLAGRPAPWKHVNFPAFLGSPDRVPLRHLRPERGIAVVYLTGFLWPDTPSVQYTQEFAEGTIRFALRDARVLKMWCEGKEVYAAPSGEDGPLDVEVKREGGWWWIAWKVELTPGTEFLTVEYRDASGRRIIPARGRDYYGFQGIYDTANPERPARLALWAPADPGRMEQKLAYVRNHLERLEGAVRKYAETYDEMPEFSAAGDAQAHEKWCSFLKQLFPAEEAPLVFHNPFTDLPYAHTFLDYQIFDGSRRHRGRSLRVIVNGPVPKQGWTVYDPSRGLYSIGQVVLSLSLGNEEKKDFRWLDWCSQTFHPGRDESALRQKIVEEKRFSTYELLGEHP